MKLAVIPSPFTEGTFVIILPPRTGTADLILCESEIEGGLPIEWVNQEIPQAMIALIHELGLGTYQMLHEETCNLRLNTTTI